MHHENLDKASDILIVQVLAVPEISFTQTKTALSDKELFQPNRKMNI